MLAFGAGTVATYTRTHFESNEARVTGGAISATIQSTSFVTDCKLTGNRASKGAAIYVDDASKLVVKNSFFKDNVATQIGGADIFAILALITIEAEYDGTETNWRHSPCFVSNLTATLMNLKGKKVAHPVGLACYPSVAAVSPR